MKRLSRPLAEHLEDDVDEAALARIWARQKAGRSSTPAFRRAWWLVGAMAMGLGLAVWGWGGGASEPVAHEAGSPAVPPTPPLSHSALEAGSVPRSERLADASTLVLGPGARVEPLAVDAHRVVLHQRRGRVEYRVAPDSERRFVVEAGTISVEVTGTRFVVDRTVDPVNVEVSEGSVLVRGDGVPDRVARLVAGQDLRAVAMDPPRSEPEDVVTPEPIRRSAPRSPEPPVPPRDEVDEVEAWMAEADRARREGRFGDAVAPLRRAAERGGSDGALASFALGRLYSDELGEPERATAALQNALRLGLPANLREPARYRLFRARMQHDVLGASDAANDYLRAHPEGPHSEQVQRWLSGR